MKDLKRQITEFHHNAHTLRENIVTSIFRFIEKHGVRNSDGNLCFLISHDVHEEYEPIWLCVEVDKDDGSRLEEEMEGLVIDNGKLYVETFSDYMWERSINTFDLIEIYEYLYYLDTEELDDLIIENGRLIVKEE